MDTEKIKALILEKCSGKNLLASEIAGEVGLNAKELWPLLHDLERAGEMKSFRNDSMTLYTASRAPARRESTFIYQSTTVAKVGTDTKVGTDSTVGTDTTVDTENIKSTCSLNAGAREEKNNYPANPEEVVEGAREIGYVMSLEEAATFLSSYASVGWKTRFGQIVPPSGWKHCLWTYKIHQKSEQRAKGLKEADRRRKGLPPIDPEEGAYEYYTDMQGRRWRKRFDETDWEFVREGSAGIT